MMAGIRLGMKKNKSSAPLFIPFIQFRMPVTRAILVNVL